MSSKVKKMILFQKQEGAKKKKKKEKLQLFGYSFQRIRFLFLPVSWLYVFISAIIYSFHEMLSFFHFFLVYSENKMFNDYVRIYFVDLLASFFMMHIPWTWIVSQNSLLYVWEVVGSMHSDIKGLFGW